MVVTILNLMITRPVLFQDWQPPSVFQSALLCCVFISFQCALGTLLIYITELHTKLTTTNRENEKLLDGMHEGLLILSKKDRLTMFCNKPAQKLLSNFLGSIGTVITQENLKNPIFQSVKMMMGIISVGSLT